ncbi:hypothetical protein [Pseudomonas monteilii]|uniref:hypothetical protein n=1 Tax=Pseudomonas monteilii TaxID=76759 RepID=UPI0018A59166|nr:hypothetical protein [Pseudomonas monteilii]BBV98551.1 hypothetical protein STW0522PSE72_39020 [Pseudomonas monteilii]
MARTRRVLVWLLTALALPMSFVEAAQVTISAQYRGGGSGRFDNTTPPGGMCQYMPYTCRTRQTVALPITYTKQTTKDAADVRDQFYVQLPGRKQIDVYHEQTGEPRQITFDWSAISQEVHGSDVTRIAPGNRDVRGGCRMVTTVSQYRPPIVRYLWDMTSPAAPQPCSVSVLQGGSGQRDTVDVTDTSVAYQLNLPPPYRLPAGIYRSSVVYSVGPGGDFDFGNQVSGLSTNTLTVDFVLDVQHAFIFEFPPGSDRAVLEPRGGWKSRLSGGRPPQRLYRDLPFRVWSTGPFKAYKLCQYNMAGTCAIRNADQHQVPVGISLSLPAGIQHRGQAVERVPLPTGRGAALQFEAATPALNRPGQLHFEVASAAVGEMLDHAGSTYNGMATVVFDAEF